MSVAGESRRATGTGIRLATMRDGTRDGRLVVVAPDGLHVAPASEIADTLQDALDAWAEAEALLSALAADVAAGTAAGLRRAQPTDFAAPLPRAWQWLDGSAFPEHGRLMQQAFGLPPIETDRPLMYQGMSHRFLAATEDVALPSEADGIDVEGEFAIVTDAVPMGCDVERAAGHIRLVLLLNDWSLRTLAPVEMKTGFGWVQAKPACSIAPFAVTPDALGDAWRDCRVQLPLTVRVNDRIIGAPDGGEMQYGFDALIAHAARTRDLPAGTIIGSGTVSNADHRRVGSTCLSEVRAIETIAHGSPQSAFLRFGDRVSMHAGAAPGPFGTIDQAITRGGSV